MCWENVVLDFVALPACFLAFHPSLFRAYDIDVYQLLCFSSPADEQATAFAIKFFPGIVTQELWAQCEVISNGNALAEHLRSCLPFSYNLLYEALCVMKFSGENVECAYSVNAEH